MAQKDFKTDIDQIAELFKLPKMEDIDERNSEYVWESGNQAYKEALADGDSESAAEEAREKAEFAAQDELFGNWHGGVMSAAEKLFEEHGLELVPYNPKRRKQKYPHEFKIVPQKSWEDAADKIRETINGVGYYHFDTLREFLDAGPWTAREAVLEHLGYIKRYPEVYASTSARSYYEAYWR